MDYLAGVVMYGYYTGLPIKKGDEYEQIKKIIGDMIKQPHLKY